MTLTDSGRSQCFVDRFWSRRRKLSCLQFYTLVLESVVLFLIKEQFLDIKEALLSESVCNFELYDSKKTRRGWMVQFGATKE